ncbi:MAG: hypothetical protein EZS28_045123, partial [Streblomastix strix]
INQDRIIKDIGENGKRLPPYHFRYGLQNPIAEVIYTYIYDKGWTGWTYNAKAIAQEKQLGKVTVRNAIKWLIENELVEVVRYAPYDHHKSFTHLYRILTYQDCVVPSYTTFGLTDREGNLVNWKIAYGAKSNYKKGKNVKTLFDPDNEPDIEIISKKGQKSEIIDLNFKPSEAQKTPCLSCSLVSSVESNPYTKDIEVKETKDLMMMIQERDQVSECESVDSVCVIIPDPEIASQKTSISTQNKSQSNLKPQEQESIAQIISEMELNAPLVYHLHQGNYFKTLKDYCQWKTISTFLESIVAKVGQTQVLSWVEEFIQAIENQSTNPINSVTAYFRKSIDSKCKKKQEEEVSMTQISEVGGEFSTGNVLPSQNHQTNARLVSGVDTVQPTEKTAPQQGFQSNKPKHGAKAGDNVQYVAVKHQLEDELEQHQKEFKEMILAGDYTQENKIALYRKIDEVNKQLQSWKYAHMTSHA